MREDKVVPSQLLAGSAVVAIAIGIEETAATTAELQHRRD